MSKRSPAFSADQLAFTFDVPAAPRHQGALAGFAREVSSAVARILDEDERDRVQMAHALSRLLDEDIDKTTVDGWASESRHRFNIAFYRLLALVAVTDRVDVLDALLRKIGVAALFGEEIITAQIGHLDRKIAALNAQKKEIQQRARPMARARTGDA